MTQAPVSADRPPHFGLIGTYDVENFGDCIFPDVYRQQLGKRFPGARFTCYSPRAAAAAIVTDPALTALPGEWAPPPFTEDCLFLTGGETLSIGHSSGTYILPATTPSAFLRLWLVPILATRGPNTRFMVHCCGLAPGADDVARAVGEGLAFADRVTVRDTVSARRLGGAIPTAVDPAFLMDELQAEAEWKARAERLFPSAGGYIAAQVSQSYIGGDDFARWCAVVAAMADEHGKALVLLPICNFLGDFDLLAMARDNIVEKGLLPADRVFALPRGLNVLDTAAVIARSDGFVGTSLHGAVASVAFAKPKAILTKSLDGKHAQTLLAAGADGAACVTIADLPETYRRNLRVDHDAERREAGRRAARDFDALCEAIRAPVAAKSPLPAALLKTIATLDRRPIAAIEVRLKRAIFLQMKRFPALWEAYERRKFARRH